MEITKSVFSASVSSQNIIPQPLPTNDEQDAETVIELISKFDFKVSENEKDLFLEELEKTLENEFSDEYLQSTSGCLVNFFIKHVTLGELVISDKQYTKSPFI